MSYNCVRFVISFKIGDVVLICLDDAYDQYVMFTSGKVLHFLHSDCYEPLGLKTGTYARARDVMTFFC